MSEVFIHDLMAYDGLKIFQKEKTFRFSLDSLLLADFVKVNRRANRLLELGSGSGAILFYLTLKTDIELHGVEIQEEQVELALKGINYNNLDQQIKVHHLDMKKLQEIFPPSHFDIVVSNPPFFKNNDYNMVNNEISLSMARHEISIDLEELIVSAKKMLKTNGQFYMIHRASRLEEIILLLSKHNFVIKRMRFVYTKPGKDSMMVLMEIRSNGKIGNLKIEEPLYILDDKDEYTDEVKRIFHLGDDKYAKESELSE